MRHQAMQTYLLRANPSIVVANRSCNLESGDRSSPPEDNRWEGGLRMGGGTPMRRRMQGLEFWCRGAGNSASRSDLEIIAITEPVKKLHLKNALHSLNPLL